MQRHKGAEAQRHRNAKAQRHKENNMKKNNGMLILTTVPDFEAGKKIAEALVNEHLAACVNIMPQVDSIYPWKGKICNDKEHMLFIKTVEPKVKKVFERIVQMHPYEVPELVALEINAIGDSYWGWMQDWLISK